MNERHGCMPDYLSTMYCNISLSRRKSRGGSFALPYKLSVGEILKAASP